MNTISMNGKCFELKSDGRVFVNGQEWGPLGSKPGESPKDNHLQLDADGCIKGSVNGDLYITSTVPVTLVVRGDIQGSIKTDNGSVTCSNIGGSVTAEGDVGASNIGGSVRAEGNVSAGIVGGSVRSNG